MGRLSPSRARLLPSGPTVVEWNTQRGRRGPESMASQRIEAGCSNGHQRVWETHRALGARDCPGRVFLCASPHRRRGWMVLE